MGRCPGCQTWDSLVEQIEEPASAGRAKARLGAEPTPLSQAPRSEGQRLQTGIGELDRVLGGGIMPGGAVLVGGDPGIGKSTLMLQVFGTLAGRIGPVLYVSGEESARQIRLRADRLGIIGEKLLLLTETRVEAVLARIKEIQPRALCLDSIQTLESETLTSLPGSLAQIRESSARFVRLAKSIDLPVFLVGHVTKSGALAGPKIVEHMVDTVLYFESGQDHGFRIIRAMKNRFGSTNEIGVFEMKERGLTEVANPSALFLTERPEGQAGSVVVPCLEGSRPLLVEIQALAAPSPYSQSKRTALGVDSGRVSMLAAVMERKLGLTFSGHDLFINAAGGMKIREPGADLGLALALASSLTDRPADPKTVFLGEVGLAGEIRSVGRAEPRLSEAAKLGFERAVVPARLVGQLKRPPLKLIGVDYIGRALDKALL